MDDLPASAFDSPEQKARLAEIFEEYNDTLTLDRASRTASSAKSPGSERRDIRCAPI